MLYLQDYNVVRYPASKWVCTKSVIDVSDDPLKDWEVVFNNDPMAAMAAKKKMNRPTSTMFKKLFRYIIGVNSEQAEIKMTRPVTTIRQKIKGKPGMETAVMCFWTGTPPDPKVPTTMPYKATRTRSPCTRSPHERSAQGFVRRRSKQQRLADT